MKKKVGETKPTCDSWLLVQGHSWMQNVMLVYKYLYKLIVSFVGRSILYFEWAFRVILI